MSNPTRSRPEKWILLGIPVLFVIGSLMHFAFQLLWENPIVGLIAPVNESIWEHAKLLVWPMILWWVLYERFRGKMCDIDRKKWFQGALAALLLAWISMPLLYYFYTQAFGISALWVDILIFLLCVLFGQFLGLHVYRHGKGLSPALVFVLFLLIVLLMMVFTYFPPEIPWFQDTVTGKYGIAAASS